MALYQEVSVTGYNASPPPDDGTHVAGNEISWAGIKTKLTDPLETAIEDTQANVTDLADKVGIALITSGSVNNAASLDIVMTGFATYRAYKFVLIAIQPANDGDALLMRTSTDGGSNYDNGDDDYQWVFDGAGSFEDDNSDTDDSTDAITVIESLGVAARTSNIELTLFEPSDNDHNKQVLWTASQQDTDGFVRCYVGAGVRKAVATINAVRFMCDTGHVSLTYAVYGYQ